MQFTYLAYWSHTDAKKTGIGKKSIPRRSVLEMGKVSEGLRDHWSLRARLAQRTVAHRTTRKNDHASTALTELVQAIYVRNKTKKERKGG